MSDGLPNSTPQPSERANEADQLNLSSLTKEVEKLWGQVGELGQTISEIKSVSAKHDALQEKYNKLEPEIKKLVDLAPDIPELKNERIRTIEMISVFVALITFVSAQVNIFKDQPLPAVLGFSLILGGFLVVFVLLVHMVSRSLILENKRRDLLPERLLITIIFLIILGAGILLFFDRKEELNKQSATSVELINSKKVNIK